MGSQGGSFQFDPITFLTLITEIADSYFIKNSKMKNSDHTKCWQSYGETGSHALGICGGNVK